MGLKPKQNLHSSNTPCTQPKAHFALVLSQNIKKQLKKCLPKYSECACVLTTADHMGSSVAFSTGNMWAPKEFWILEQFESHILDGHQGEGD